MNVCASDRRRESLRRTLSDGEPNDNNNNILLGVCDVPTLVGKELGRKPHTIV